MPKVYLRNKVGLIVHAISKIVLGDYTAKNGLRYCASCPPPHGAFCRCKDKEEEEESLCSSCVCGHIQQCINCNANTIYHPRHKYGQTTNKKKAAKPVDLCMTLMWGKTTNSASHPVVAIAHGQNWFVSNTTTIDGDIANKPLSGCQCYQKGPSGKRIVPGNPDFANMLWGSTWLMMTRTEGNKVGEGPPTKNNSQPSMEAVQ